MKKKVFILVGWLVFSMASICPGSEGRLLRTQGLINPGGNLKAGYVLINEIRVYIDNKTQVVNERNIPVPASELKPKRWVYMEVERDPVQEVARANKIYLLFRYIHPSEIRNYPFMK